jgi:trimethylamine-N-oxide reductase (cytochrome c), cytochrome c-type subunit TorC
MINPSGRPSGRRIAALGLVVLGVAAGVAAVFVGQEADTYFSSNKFCNSCHEMEATVYQELQQSGHAKAASGVQPTCGHCHVAQKLFPALWDHFMGTGDLIAHLRGISTVEKFEERRAEVADKERLKMLGQNSRNCQRCHVMPAIKPSKPRGVTQHKEALAKGNSNCIACHYNLVHKEVPASDAFSKAAEKYQ